MDDSTTNLLVVRSQYYCWSLMARCICNPKKDLGKAEGHPFSAAQTSLYPSSAHTSTGLSASGPSLWDTGSENISSRGEIRTDMEFPRLRAIAVR